MSLVLRYGGVALMVIGVTLLVFCRLAGLQSNAELLAALALVVAGYLLHVWLQKRGEKY